MTPERYQQIEKIYNAALELKPEELTPYLEEVCKGDDQLIHEVRRLLEANEEATSFLNKPAVEGASPGSKPEPRTMVGRQVGRYQLTSRLGSGGMGEVYLARDTKLGRKVAVKILPPDGTRQHEMVLRFEQEAIAASSLNHPNIITIHEIGEADGIYFITTEFIEGMTLRRRLESGSIPPREAVDIAIQIATALDAAHRAGIIHRDIKPENAMIRPDGLVKVLDFGLAKLNPASSTGPLADSQGLPVNLAHTTPGMILGTVSYMSPEQARGKDLDGRTDIWSLGVVLYELLTGKKPFSGDNATDVLLAVIQREPPAVDSLLPGAPPELMSILRKALAKDKNNRHRTAGEMAEELRRFRDTFLDKNDSIRPPAPGSQPEPGEVSQYRTSLSVQAIRDSLARTAPGDTDINRGSKTVVRAQAEPARAARRQPLRLSWMAVAGSILAIIVIAALGSLVYLRRSGQAGPGAAPPPEPERSLSFFLTVQKMRDGSPYREPFESGGQDVFGDGWKFRINFSSPQAGYLYVLNEGPTSGGAISYNLLFPYKSRSLLPAETPIQTGWYQLTDNPGTEKLWLVFSREAIPELESVENVEIRDAPKLDFIRRMLDQQEMARAELSTDKVKERSTIRGRGAILIHPLELKHR